MIYDASTKGDMPGPNAPSPASPVNESATGPTPRRTIAAVRVRYAPSPTGSPHIGNIRTALFNWLLARHTGGTFIVRIEDTDQNRLVPGAVEAILESLRWLGLDWDEGPERGGPSGPYYQSERLPLYRQYAEQLVAQGHAYHCYCTPAELDATRQAHIDRKEQYRHNCGCPTLSPDDRSAREAAGAPSVIRFSIPKTGQTTFTDLFRGDISFDNITIDDYVLLKSDGWPTYQLANVVDDHLMGITHVLRGDEWISSTPKHVLEYVAFGWEPPKFGHFALILGKDRAKLSKRHGATDVLSYRSAGYLPEAIVNFLSLLGWSPPAAQATENAENAEVLHRAELIAAFDLDRVGVTASVFDSDKLDWMNGYYIRQLPPERVAKAVTPFLREAGLVPAGELPVEVRSKIAALVPLIRERLKRLTDAPALVDFIFAERLSYDSALLVQKGMDRESTARALAAARQRIAGLPSFDETSLEVGLRPLADELSLKAGQLFGAIRVATSGRNVAPPLFQTLVVLGREVTDARLAQAIAILG